MSLLKNLKKLDLLYDYIILDSPTEKLIDSNILTSIIQASDLIISPFIESYESLILSEKLHQKVQEIKSNDNAISFFPVGFSYEKSNLQDHINCLIRI